MRKKKLITAEIGNYPSWIYPELADPRLFLPWLREKIRGKKSIHLELGMGTGDFLICKALEYPDSFFLGVDTKDYRLMQAMKKAKHLGLQNIAFLQAPIENLMSYQIPMVDHLYLLFSDPWPKRKHAERRLTHRGFLKLYEQIMNPSAQMLFKTDDLPYYQSSLQEYDLAGWTIREKSEDYMTPSGQETTFERKWKKRGKNISMIMASPPKDVYFS